ncbi:MAG: EAL domain-containing protein [Proteobacteria bacterium]|nr:EAL domain-containing protein [Pseudomonadota bacterium]
MPASNEQIDLLCAQTLFKGALPANITLIAGTALTSAFYYTNTGSALIYWVVAMLLIAAVRIIGAQRFLVDQERLLQQLNTDAWVTLYVTASLASGIGWAVLPLFLPADIDATGVSVLYILYFTIMSATIVSLPAVLSAYIAYSTPIFISAFLYPFAQTSQPIMFLSIAAIIYFFFIISAGRLLNKRYRHNFSLIIENETLIEELHNEIEQKEQAQKKISENQLVLEDTVDKRTRELSDTNKALVNEINERCRIESNLKHIAHHDSLTNLPNRLLLDARLNHAIEQAKRSDLQVAIIFIDLDHFKTINDSLGHSAGDELLIAVSRKLLNCIREGDTVARLGGDEFIIIIEQLHDIIDLNPILKKIMRATSSIVSIRDHELVISASLGISIYPDHGDNADTLMRNADAAMYYVKDHGRQKYRFYTRDLTTSAYDRVILETDLSRALENDELLVYYQPQVSLKTKNIVGVEALVRWQHPELGLLTPKQFLPIAEKSSLINRIGEVVLLQACEQMVAWKKQGLPIKTVAVNIAGNQIHHGNLVAVVERVLQKTRCETDWLELEITEDFIINKTDKALTTLRRLRELGISLAIDDFGTGYSSLSYLKQLPINKLKIDRAFVRDIDDDMEDATLVQAIIAMGRSLKLKLIAEGVENSSHEIFLAAHGCEYAQGYYYSEPVRAEKIIKLCAEQDRALHDKVRPINGNSD